MAYIIIFMLKIEYKVTATACVHITALTKAVWSITAMCRQISPLAFARHICERSNGLHISVTTLGGLVIELHGVQEVLDSISDWVGPRPPQSACHKRWNSITVLLTRSHQCRRLVHKKAVHVLSCLCNDACKRSLAICRKSRALCLVSRLLSVPIWPACVKQGR